MGVKSKRANDDEEEEIMEQMIMEHPSNHPKEETQGKDDISRDKRLFADVKLIAQPIDSTGYQRALYGSNQVTQLMTESIKWGSVTN